MRLIKLYSNKETFHTVNFKPGVNFVIGKATKGNADNTQKTYNSLGKSLLIKLIDFCLACEAVPEFEKKMPEWEFSLEFEVGDIKYTSTRSTLKQNKITLNNEEITLDAFREKLLEEVFGITEQINYLTWRTLISRFTRPRKDSYYAFDKTFSKETDYTKLLNTSYLLGIDVKLVEKKRELKSEFDRIEGFKKNLQSDEIFQKYFTQNKEIDIEIIEIEDQIKKLKTTLESFEVSESYYQIQKDADQLKYDAQLIKNKVTLVRNSIRNINRSLDVKSDIQPDQIIKMYDEVNKSLPEKVVKTINEVSAFHEALIQSRSKRLLENKENLEKELHSLEQKRSEYGVKLDELLKFLGKHKALDEFVAINEKLTISNTNLQKLKSYKGLLQEYKNKTDEIKALMLSENIKTNNYLDGVQPILDKNINTFRSLSKQFYDNKAGGIDLRTNDGENQLRFNINVHIDDDTSDGISEVKIFCFDMTLLLTHHHHIVKFILHDSRLFSNMDPRQLATLFRLAQSHSETENTQYIATINQNQVEPLRSHYSVEEYKNIIDDNIILTLTDASDETRLLGVHVNLDYESSKT